MVGFSRGSSITSKFYILFSLSTITSPVSDMMVTDCKKNEHTEGRREKEANGKEGE